MADIPTSTRRDWLRALALAVAGATAPVRAQDLLPDPQPPSQRGGAPDPAEAADGDDPAALEPRALPRLTSGVVIAALDGATLRLEDNRVARLSGLEILRPRNDATDRRAQDPGAQARRALEALTLDRRITLRRSGARVDRYDHVVGQALRADGLWVQGALIRRGLSRVWPVPDQRGALRPLLALEATARAARRGLWDQDAFRPLAPEDAGDLVGRFALFEGVPVRVGPARAGLWIDFAIPWRQALSLRVDGLTLRRARAAGVDLGAVLGRRLRVRGVVEWEGGPRIQVIQPEQIELVA